ncbi:ABC transporter substrate-binding protein, partial [Jiangella anatolica]|uniref:ABC transporter substrate-binding protein n=1 Tax=Jiangella anatolica TaxID=2670374 RepID=UPI0018F619B0
MDADGESTAGTGPYTIDSWQKGKETELTLKAFEGYWGGWKPEQYKKVAFRVTPEITTAWQLLQRGEVDYVQRLNPQLFQQAQSTDGVQTTESPSFQNLLVLFNTADGPTRDPKVRQALQLAIDYDGLVAALE